MKFYVYYILVLLFCLFFSLPLPLYVGAILTFGLVLFAPTAAYYLISISPAVLLSGFGVRRVITVPLACLGLVTFGTIPHYLATKWVLQEEENQKKGWISNPLAEAPHSISIFSLWSVKKPDNEDISNVPPCTELCQKMLYGRSVDWVGVWGDHRFDSEHPEFFPMVSYNYSDLPTCPYLLSQRQTALPSTVNHILQGQCIVPKFMTSEIVDVTYRRIEKQVKSPYLFVDAGSRVVLDLWKRKDGQWAPLAHHTTGSYKIPTLFPLFFYGFGEDVPTTLRFSAKKFEGDVISEEDFINKNTGIKFEEDKAVPVGVSAMLIGKLLDQTGTDAFGNERMQFINEFLRGLANKRDWSDDEQQIVLRLLKDLRVRDNSWVVILVANKPKIIASAIPEILKKLNREKPLDLDRGANSLGPLLSKLYPSELNPYSAEIIGIVENEGPSEHAALMEAVGEYSFDSTDLQKEVLARSKPNDEYILEATIAGICNGNKAHAETLAPSLFEFIQRQLAHSTIQEKYIGAAMVMLKRLGHDQEYQQLIEQIPANIPKERLELDLRHQSIRLSCLERYDWN